MKLGLCLSGGGVKGAAHIGAIKAMEESNIKFDYISGTSSGSIVATLYALGYSPDEMYVIFKKYCKKIKYIDFSNIFKVIFGVIFKGKLIIEGLNSGKIIEKLIKKFAEDKGIVNISEINKPLIIPSVNLRNGELYCFTSKSVRNTFSDEIRYINDIEIGRAVRASCSYPGVFAPCLYKETKLIDGGVRENTPWKETKALGADKVVSIVFENEIDDKCCHNIIEISERAISLICRELSNYELDGTDCLIKIKSEGVGLLDTKKIDELYQLGYEETKRKIKNIKLL